jgi:hemoglobin
MKPSPDETVLAAGQVPFTHREIHQVVDTFYARVQSDPELKIPFQSVHDWPEHIERLTHFWWLLFGGKPYMWSQYNPVIKHFYAGFTRPLLGRWLELFHSVLQENLSEEQAKHWGDQAERMGQNLAMRNEMLEQQRDGGATS